jgi:hypothetical protein
MALVLCGCGPSYPDGAVRDPALAGALAKHSCASRGIELFAAWHAALHDRTWTVRLDTASMGQFTVAIDAVSGKTGRCVPQSLAR